MLDRAVARALDGFGHCPRQALRTDPFGGGDSDPARYVRRSPDCSRAAVRVARARDDPRQSAGFARTSRAARARPGSLHGSRYGPGVGEPGLAEALVLRESGGPGRRDRRARHPVVRSETRDAVSDAPSDVTELTR